MDRMEKMYYDGEASRLLIFARYSERKHNKCKGLLDCITKEKEGIDMLPGAND